MAVVENTLKVDMGSENGSLNWSSEMKRVEEDEQKVKVSNKDNENHNREMRELEEMLSKLNPSAKEFVPHTLLTNLNPQFHGPFVPNLFPIPMDDPFSPFTIFGNHQIPNQFLRKVWRNWRENTVVNIIDPTLSTERRTEMVRCIHMGLLCVQESVEDRPTMSSVVLMLSSHSLTLPLPSHPPFISHGNSVPNGKDLSSLGSSSINEDSISEFYAR